MEASDDRGEAYKVEVRLDDGTEVDVSLDKDLTVVSKETEGRDDSSDASDDDDRALSATERASAEKAALNAVNNGGTVTEVEASDDGGEAYEVEVRLGDGTEWDVELDANFKVLSKSIDN